MVPRIYSSHKGFEKSLYGTFLFGDFSEPRRDILRIGFLNSYDICSSHRKSNIQATFKKAEERLYAGNTQAVRQSCCSEGED